MLVMLGNVIPSDGIVDRNLDELDTAELIAICVIFYGAVHLLLAFDIE